MAASTLKHGKMTPAQRERSELRSLLYRKKVPSHKGGVEKDATEQQLVCGWPKYLDHEMGAARPTLYLKDVEVMLEEQQTPRFGNMPPRDLDAAERDAIRAWHSAFEARQRAQLGAPLAHVQSNVMGQAAANHDEVKDELRELKRGLAELLKGQEAEREERAKKKARKDARLFKELFGDEAAEAPEGVALAQEPVAQLARKRSRAAPTAAAGGHSAAGAAPAPKGGYTRWPVELLRETLEKKGKDSEGNKATLVARLKKLEVDCRLARATPQERAAPAAPAEKHAEEAKRLAAFVHACGADLAQKLHGDSEAAQLAPFEGAEDFKSHSDWEHHQRLEVNTRLDGVSRDLTYAARGDTEPVKLQKAWLTRLLLNKRGALAAVEEAYRAKVGRSLYEGECDEAAFAEALAKTKLDNACSRMRRVQWNLEAKKQETVPCIPFRVGPGLFSFVGLVHDPLSSLAWLWLRACFFRCYSFGPPPYFLY